MSVPTVIILDMSRTQAVEFQHLLEQAGCHAMLAGSVEETLTASREPDVAVVVVNGDDRQSSLDELAERLHATRPDISVLVHGGQVVHRSAGYAVARPQLRRADLAAGVADLAKQAIAQRAPNLLEGARLLLVEDSITYREYVRLELLDRGVEVTCAGTAAEVFSLMAGSSFDCILVDLVLPGIDGIRLCAELDRLRREQQGCFHIVALTSREEDERAIQALIAGADDFLGKSLSTEMLMARLVSHLRRVTAEKGKASDLLIGNQSE
jgi:CheY-like chemotaxis protein